MGRQRCYSKVTGTWRRCFVYTPPDYGTSAKAKYPVLYLLHGWGEDETGWYTEGHVDFIMDNMIAAAKAKPMRIVIDNLNAVKPGENASLSAALGLVPAPGAAPPASGGGTGAPGRGVAPGGGAPGFNLSTFTDIMFAYMFPMIERTYRAMPGERSALWRGSPWGHSDVHDRAQ